jgi:hypothetical protein
MGKLITPNPCQISFVIKINLLYYIYQIIQEAANLILTNIIWGPLDE